MKNLNDDLQDLLFKFDKSSLDEDIENELIFFCHTLSAPV
jgi:hypothetical protein